MSPSKTDAAELEVSVERLPGSQAKLTVQAPPADVDRALVLALGHLGLNYRLPGFRPGKAPAAVVERAVGWDALRQHAIEDLLPEVWARAVAQVELEPVSTPDVSEVVLERGEPFRFTASVVLRPEVELGDYRKIKVPVAAPEISEDAVDETLAALRQRYAQLDDASEREARLNDVITADLTMRHNGEVVGTPAQSQTLDLERGDLLPGMADQLLGARVGEPVEVTLTLPEEYGRPELRGELVVITADVKQIQAKELPALDDNLATIAGHGESLAELRLFVRDQLTEEARIEAEQAQEAKSLEELVAVSRVEVPEAMIQTEIDRQIKDLELRLSASGISLEQLLASDGKPLEQLRGERRQPAVERVQLELILDQVARREGLQVSDDELDENLGRIFAKGASKESRRRAREPLRRELLLGQSRRLVAALARGEAGLEPAHG
ncbi:MAG TPA: trigger factor [Candidatus Dormibacteraeota bacterium]|nr:trigger factor [Candidatus Dormibacteraeota bacterium]